MLSEMEGSTTITKEELKEMLPHMTKTQTDIIFDACRSQMAFQLKQEMHRATFMKLSASIKISVDNVNKTIKTMQQEATRAEAQMQEKAEAKCKKEEARWTEQPPRPPSTDPDSAKELAREGDAQEASNRGEQAQVIPEAVGVTCERGRSSSFSCDGDENENGRPNRMQGSSQPFPGMPQAPGGYFPPLLPPDLAVRDQVGGEDRPEWLGELDAAVELQNQWMLAIQSQLQELQWMWHMAQKDTAQRRSCMRASRQDEEAVDFHGGIPIL